MFWQRENAGLAATPMRAALSVALHRRYLLAGAILMLALVNLAGVIFSADSQAASSGPAVLSTYLGTQVAAAYTRATRLADKMRLLYHVTRLQELKLQPAGTAGSASTPRMILCKESATTGQPRKTRT